MDFTAGGGGATTTGGGKGAGVGVGAGVTGIMTGAGSGVTTTGGAGVTTGALAQAASKEQSKTGESLRNSTVLAISCKKASLGQNPPARQCFIRFFADKTARLPVGSKRADQPSAQRAEDTVNKGRYAAAAQGLFSINPASQTTRRHIQVILSVFFWIKPLTHPFAVSHQVRFAQRMAMHRGIKHRAEGAVNKGKNAGIRGAGLIAH